MFNRYDYAKREKETERIKNAQEQRLKSHFLHPVFYLLFKASNLILNDSEWIKLHSEYLEDHVSYPFAKHRMKHKYRVQTPNTMKLYHGTKIEQAALILARQGLMPGAKRNIGRGNRGGMFGDAIYVGPRDKAINYTGGVAYSSHDRYGVMFEVEVNTGKILTVDKIGDYRNECDTVHAPQGWNGGSWTSLRNEEYAVYNPKRVKILAFELVKSLPYK